MIGGASQYVTFGMVGLSTGQTARLNVLALPVGGPIIAGGSCQVTFDFYNEAGKMVKSGTATVAQGRRSISTCYGRRSSTAWRRTEIRGTVRTAFVNPSAVPDADAGYAGHTHHTHHTRVRVLFGTADTGDIRFDVRTDDGGAATNDAIVPGDTAVDQDYFVMVPQAMRSPALPAGSDFMSSALAWITSAVSAIDKQGMIAGAQVYPLGRPR